MSETIIWVWNGWGLLFTGLVALWCFSHILVTVKLGSGTPLRNVIAPVMLISVAMTFMFSGWIVGIMSIPIGFFVGVFLAKLFIRQERAINDQN